jgi:hypothetical protein
VTSLQRFGSEAPGAILHGSRRRSRGVHGTSRALAFADRFGSTGTPASQGMRLVGLCRFLHDLIGSPTVSEACLPAPRHPADPGDLTTTRTRTGREDPPGLRSPPELTSAPGDCPPKSAGVATLSWDSSDPPLRRVHRWKRRFRRDRRRPRGRVEDLSSARAFRPRGFAPPRRFAPPPGRGLVASRCRPWGSPRFVRVAAGSRQRPRPRGAGSYPPKDNPRFQPYRVTTALASLPLRERL